MPYFWFGLMKSALFPVRQFAALCPTQGTIVDLGCGNGFLSYQLAHASQKRHIIGYDWDAQRVAKSKTFNPLLNLEFRVANIVQALHEVRHVDHFLISDVLYLLDPATQKQVLTTCYHKLPSGGVLLLKVSDTTPYWKYCFESFQETLAVKVLSISKSKDKKLFLQPVAEYQRFLTSLGFSTVVHRLDAYRPYPHVALVATKEERLHA